jgi:hypothetical protein
VFQQSTVLLSSKYPCNEIHFTQIDDGLYLWAKLRVGGRVAVRVLAVLEQMEEKEYAISIDSEMRQVLYTTRCFHFAPCSTSNLVISSHRP